MDFVLTLDSTITCPHDGKVSLVSSAKLKVNGARVLLLAGVAARPISGCKTENSNSTKKCTTVASATGTAAKLKVANQGVVLSTVKGPTDGVPQPAVISVADIGQTILKAL